MPILSSADRVVAGRETAAVPPFKTYRPAFWPNPDTARKKTPCPLLLKAYVTLKDLFDNTSLTPTEQQIVLLAASFQNQCEYCVAAHTVIAGMQKVPPGVVDAIRDGRPQGRCVTLRPPGPRGRGSGARCSAAIALDSVPGYAP
ncbi:MAG: carboxymuconolactone decarboxylase family protein [Pseudomonadota bacterium]